MSYAITQRMTISDCIYKECETADNADDAIECCKRLAGIFKSVVNERFEERVRNLEKGQKASIRNKDLKLSITVRRTKK